MEAAAEMVRNINRAIIITFLVGVTGIVYFVTSLYLLGTDPTLSGVPESYLSWMMLERVILIGMLVVILIIMSYVLMIQKGLEESRTSEKEHTAKSQRNEKEIRDDIMRYYRDMGAFKIVLKDGVMDTKTYNDRKKYLEEMVKERKKQLEKLQHKNQQ